MQRAYHRWHSPALDRDMELLVFGHAGARVLAFPTSMGRFYDWEDRRLIDAVADFVEQGWVQFICVDSVDAESWYAKDKPPAERVRRHDRYDHYVRHEVVPWSERLNPNPFLIAAGASFGAYHAVNFAGRYPDVVGRALGMSGLYDIRQFLDGYHDELVYFHNPIEFLAQEHDPARLTALRRLDLILAIGRDDPNRANNEDLSGRLWANGIGNALRIWDGWAHDWPYWQRMLRLYLGGHD